MAESRLQHIESLFFKYLPHLAEYIGAAAAAGVRVSPQAEAAAAFIQFLASLHHSAPEPAPTPTPATAPAPTAPPEPPL